MDCAVSAALNTLSAVEPIVVTDDGASQERSYLICPAQQITHAHIAMMLNEARGVICAALSERRIAQLELPPMGRSQGAVEFLTSVEAREGTRTGISAHDRATTFRALALGDKHDLVSPGHVFPLRAMNGGVLVRAGIAEAAVDLVMAAGKAPVAALSHLLDPTGEVLAPDQVRALAARLSCPVVTLSDVIRFRLDREQIVQKIADARLPTREAGVFRAIGFRSLIDNSEHLALVKGDITESDRRPVLVRVQSGNRLGDLFITSGLRGNDTISHALVALKREGRGVFVYVRHWEQGAATSLSRLQNTPLVMREYGIGAQILRALGVRRLRLLSSSEHSFHALRAFSLCVEECVRFPSAP